MRDGSTSSSYENTGTSPTTGNTAAATAAATSRLDDGAFNTRGFTMFDVLPDQKRTDVRHGGGGGFPHPSSRWRDSSDDDDDGDELFVEDSASSVSYNSATSRWTNQSITINDDANRKRRIEIRRDPLQFQPKQKQRRHHHQQHYNRRRKKQRKIPHVSGANHRHILEAPSSHGTDEFDSDILSSNVSISVRSNFSMPARKITIPDDMLEKPRLNVITHRMNPPKSLNAEQGFDTKNAAGGGVRIDESDSGMFSYMSKASFTEDLNQSFPMLVVRVVVGIFCFLYSFVALLVLLTKGAKAQDGAGVSMTLAFIVQVCFLLLVVLPASGWIAVTVVSMQARMNKVKRIVQRSAL